MSLMDVDSQAIRGRSHSPAHELWTRFPEIRTTQHNVSLAHSLDNIAPKAIGSLQVAIPSKLALHTPWLGEDSTNTIVYPLRLFGEALPSLSSHNLEEFINLVTNALLRNHKLALFGASAQIESLLDQLSLQFDTELRSLAKFIRARLAQLPPVDIALFSQQITTRWQLLLTRSLFRNSDSRALSIISSSIRNCLLSVLGFCSQQIPEDAIVRERLDAAASMIIKDSISRQSILVRCDPTSQAYYELQLLQHLCLQYRRLDREAQPGHELWTFLEKLLISLPLDHKWAIVLLFSMINTERNLSNKKIESMPRWSVVKELIAEELSQPANESVNWSPSKHAGFSHSILDLLLRVRWFCNVWSGISDDFLLVLSKYFAERLFFYSLHASQLFSDVNALRASQNPYHQYLTILHDYYSSATDEAKRQRHIMRVIESCLNILDDIPTHLDPIRELPTLLRNAFQLAIILVPFMQDSGVQSILLERLIYLPLDRFPPGALDVTISGYFSLLAELSRPNPTLSLPEMPFAEIYTRPNSGADFEASLLPFPDSRTGLVDHISTQLWPHLLSTFTAIANNAGTVDLWKTTTFTQISQEPFKKVKQLEIDDGSKFIAIEQLVLRYLSEIADIWETAISSAALALVPGLGDLISDSHASDKSRDLTIAALINLVVRIRDTSLNQESRSVFENLYAVASRVLAQNVSDKHIQCAAELQGIAMTILTGNPKWSWSEYVNQWAGASERHLRAVSVHALRAWLQVHIRLVKKNPFLRVQVDREGAAAMASIVLNATLESTLHPALPDLFQQLLDLKEAILQPYNNTNDAPLSKQEIAILVQPMSAATVDKAKKGTPPGQLSALVLDGVLTWKAHHPDQAVDVSPYLPLLVRYLDVTVMKNRAELASNFEKASRYDDRIVPFIGLCFKHIPTWLHNKSDARYNVFGRLINELFISPIKEMAYNAANDRIRNTAPPVAKTTTTTMGGIVFGKSSTSTAKKTPVVAPPRALPPSPPAKVYEATIRALPSAILGIALLQHATDGDLQRYFTDIVVGIFRTFIGAMDSGHDTRLIDMFSSGLFALRSDSASATSSEASPELAVHAPRLSDLRLFFFANIVPWITGLVHKDAGETSHTNAFILARLLAWIFVRAKYSGENRIMGLVQAFILTIYQILDLFNARKPTKHYLVKKELVGTASRFCSTLLQLLPNNPLNWLQEQDSELHSEVLSALKAIVDSLVRDIESIMFGTWPTVSLVAPLHDHLRSDYTNAMFERTADPAARLSTITLYDASGKIDGLKDLAAAYCELLNYIRQLGATDIVNASSERIRKAIYTTSSEYAQRQARLDVKAAKQVFQASFNKS